MVQVLFQPDEPDEDNAPILAARARLKAALDILRELSETKQVICFTCQSREKKSFAPSP